MLVDSSGLELVSTLPKILVFGATEAELQPVTRGLSEHCELVRAETVADAITTLGERDIQGVCVLGRKISPTSFLLESRGLLQQIPDGLALLDASSRVLWHNDRLQDLIGNEAAIDGRTFLSLFRDPEFLGPDFGPLHTALASGETARTLMRVGETAYFELAATPINDEAEEYPSHLLATVRDVSRQTVERQKLDRIYRAGLELGDLQPQDVSEMSVDDRVELLKSKILYYTQDVLEFETVEIRLVDPETKHLKSLLAVGMDPLAENRKLFALPEGNGVTGFVAATGKSYLCEDTALDPLYLPGAPGARSSLTVPLVMHDEILGTFNVESPRPGAFTQADLQFLELFCREVAIALNTLNLLVAEKATTISEASRTLLRDVAGPVDEILNDVAWVREQALGSDSGVVERLERVLGRTRQIRELIQLAGGQPVGDAIAQPAADSSDLRTRRILVVDSDQEVRRSAHELLGRCGCIVETARDGHEALLMARTFHYDAVIADIRLPDMRGSECFRLFRELQPDLPVILMTGFGYDCDHSLVKARQMGMKTALFKPFRRDLLLKALHDAITPSPAHAAPQR